jgi:hypothetical protein
MADTTISGLSFGATPADADVYEAEQSGVSKKLAHSQLKTYITTAPTWAAGSATAGSKPKLTSGTVLTTPEAGALEYDGVQIYETIDTSSGRGAIPVEQYFHLNAIGSTIGTPSPTISAPRQTSRCVSGAYYDIEIHCYFLKTRPVR